MSLCSRPKRISALIITGRMVIGPTYCAGPPTLMLGVRIGVPTLGLSACLGRGVPEEELAPRFEFFLTNCSSTAGSDPGDSIVGMSLGTMLHASAIMSWVCLEARQGRARDFREELSLRGSEKAWLGRRGGSVVMARNNFPWLEYGKSEEGSKGKFTQ
ncbi:hypothetical protein FNV43_RR21631 [Rhamnella rubrinervis]|uniref:Uncharacterized protein n=1 Tax=Rhamnella rubrinervis TaxID=2594499 RepID=A0A8K0GRB6_9ROSA|nr:hypothetical protein FNV43_RR21631 [Rhamnella rubrinervis]